MLLKLPRISKLIETIGLEIQEKSKTSTEEKASMAWLEYNKAQDTKDRQFWWQEWCKLSGAYVQRIETKTDMTITVNNDDKSELMRLRKAMVDDTQTIDTPLLR